MNKNPWNKSHRKIRNPLKFSSSSAIFPLFLLAHAILFEIDSPGMYTVLRDAAVTTKLSLESEEVRELQEGDVVEVVEVMEHAEESRKRGRIEGGWVSLRDTSDGYRWMVPQVKFCMSKKFWRVL